jgi:hypothetical protein
MTVRSFEPDPEFRQKLAALKKKKQQLVKPVIYGMPDPESGRPADFPEDLWEDCIPSTGTNDQEILEARKIVSYVTGDEIMSKFNLHGKDIRTAKNWINFLCPFHTDKKISAGMSRDMSPVFKCFTCEIDISGFEFWCLVSGRTQPLKGTYYIQALVDFLAFYGKPNPITSDLGD